MGKDIAWLGSQKDFARMAWAGARKLGGRKKNEAEEAEEAAEARGRLGRELVCAGESRDFDGVERLLTQGADIGWLSGREAARSWAMRWLGATRRL